MTRARHNPRKGSIAYRPRVRASKETPTFHSFPETNGPAKPLNFFGYKVGMIHVIAQSLHTGGRHDKMDVQMPTTVLECPPLHVWGVRAYAKDAYGMRVLGEYTIDKLSTSVMKRLGPFKKKSTHKKHPNTKKSQTQSSFSSETLNGMKDNVHAIRLLVHTQPDKTTFGKKMAEISEVAIAGTVDEQIAFANEKFGKTLSVKDAFGDNQTIDVKAVSRGFGFGGVVARFGVKTFRPKAKYIRAVGSISPLHPRTVQFTVARPGQLGYHNRTEFNKRILKVASDTAKINPKSGFEHYGDVRNEYVLIAGSVPGPVKRLVGMRAPIRPEEGNHYKISAVKYVSTTGGAL